MQGIYIALTWIGKRAQRRGGMYMANFQKSWALYVGEKQKLYIYIHKKQTQDIKNSKLAGIAYH